VRDDRLLLGDILDAVDRIEKHAKSGRAAFDADELVQIWVVYHLQVIGEAVSRLSMDLRTAYPEVPWSLIVGMRNILVHAYFGIDNEEIWSAVENDLPILKTQITSIRSSLESD
jgi:uncharacterized protein with HEPN domain